MPIARARCSARRSVDQPASEPPSAAFSPTGIELLDAPLVQPENAVRAALLLEVSLKLIPRAEIFAALGAMDRGFGLSIDRNLQTDGAAKRAFQLVVQILASHDLRSIAQSTGQRKQRISDDLCFSVDRRKQPLAKRRRDAGQASVGFSRSHGLERTSEHAP